MKPDTEKGIGYYVYADFLGRCNQEEGKYSDSVLSRTWYLITYANYPIIWASQIQIEISLSTTKAEYIDIFHAMRYVLPLVSLLNEIEFILKFQGDTPTVLCIIFKNPFTVLKDNQGSIALAVSTRMWPCTKHIAIKYHHF